MKNKFLFFTILALSLLSLASCAGSRGYGNHRKGYGCPSTAIKQNLAVSENKI
ncbi:MAG: hypothetical protein V4676_01395 [Bacteroidota bacterium]